MSLWVKDGVSQKVLTEKELNEIIAKQNQPVEDNEENSEAKALPMTICKNCVFAEYDEGDEEGTFRQTGCALGRLEKFDEIGTPLLLFSEPDLDEEGKELDTTKEFAVINGRICTTLREQNWINRLLVDEPEDKGITLEELMQIAKDEVNIQKNTTLIVFIPEGTPWEIVASFIDHLKGLDKPFRHTIFMNASRKLMPLTFVHNMQHYYKELPFTWQMEYVLEGTHNVMEKSLLHQCIDIAVKKCETVYYMTTDVYARVDESLVDKIEKTINEDLERLLVIHDPDSSIFSQVRLHKLVGGFTNRNYIDKITKIAKEQECPELVRTHQSLR